jgi:hypothetical protein
MGANIRHPELLLGPNPLLEVMAPFATLRELPALLRNEPLKGLAWRKLPPDRREPLLRLIEAHYSPTRECLDFAMEIQNAVRSSLVVRNPLDAREQRRINQLGFATTATEFAKHAMSGRAGGGICSAITGSGKTTLAKRVLAVIAPDQVYRHGESKACGWATLVQVTYLFIDCPFNSSRGGLLAKIVGGLDELLDTRYSEELRKIKNLDDKTLYVVRILCLHRVGMLVVDENQSGNFEENVWQAEFILFYLALMNMGIAILLLGNPLAFGSLRRFSQVMRRFSSIGYYELLPAASESEKWWDQDYLSGVSAFSLCEKVPPAAQIKTFAFKNSGGLRGLWSAQWSEGQKIALRRGGNSATLAMQDLEAARHTPRIRELTAIAAAALGTLEGRTFDDLPERIKHLAAPNSKTDGTTSAYAGRTSKKAPPTSAELKRLANSLAKSQRKQAQAMEANMKRLDRYSEDDLRRANDSLSILAGLRDEQGELFEKGTKKGRRR